jgi:hypothetical protein
MQIERTEQLLSQLNTARNKTARAAVVSAFGIHGRSLFAELLGHYVDPNNLWIVPTAHAALLGVMKLFLSVVFRDTAGVPQHVLPRWIMRAVNRKLMTQRAGHIILTNDFNRPYRDVVKNRGNWVMEDYLHFLEYSRYIFRPDENGVSMWPCPEVGEAWEELQLGLLHYFRYEEGTFTIEARKAAFLHIYRFAQLWEALVGERGCTFNLHVLVCRLFQQESARGHVSFALEFWVETQLIQYMKSDVKFRTTGCPELIFVNGLMADLAVANMRRAPAISEWDSVSAPWSSARKRGISTAAAWDEGGVQGGVRFMALGRGRLLSEDNRSGAIGLWSFGEDGRQGYLQECHGAVIGDEWEQLLLDRGVLGVDVAVSEFARVCKEGGDEFQSRLHSRARTRQSYWAVCTFIEGEGEGEGEEVPYIAQVHRFLKFAAEGVPELRAAEVSLYSCVEVSPGLFEVVDFGRGGSFWPIYMVPLPCFAHKVFHCDAGPNASHFFVRYTVFSRTIGGVLFEAGFGE